MLSATTPNSIFVLKWSLSPAPLLLLSSSVSHPNLFLRGLSPWRLKPWSLQQLLTTGEYSQRLNGTLQPPQGIPRAPLPRDPSTVFDLPSVPLGKEEMPSYAHDPLR